MYAGLLNPSYHPSRLELEYIRAPQNTTGYVNNFWHEKRWTKWLVHLAFCLCILKGGSSTARVNIHATPPGIVRLRLGIHLREGRLFVPVLLDVSKRFVDGDSIVRAPFRRLEIHILYSPFLGIESRLVLFSISCQSLLLTMGSAIVLTWGTAQAVGGDKRLTSVILISADVSLVFGSVCDIFITAFTCYHLLREKTGFTEHDSLIRCSIQSGAGPTVVALINLVMTNTVHDDLWCIVSNLALSHTPKEFSDSTGPGVLVKVPTIPKELSFTDRRNEGLGSDPNPFAYSSSAYYVTTYAINMMHDECNSDRSSGCALPDTTERRLSAHMWTIEPYYVVKCRTSGRCEHKLTSVVPKGSLKLPY
ncbi:hypothetical protein JB92DRAFT_2834516 [Gautieria morchelliformis]|nr:hypothetical protein JB92DRAFT_2834516 [Gautieria morchelliformis]